MSYNSDEYLPFGADGEDDESEDTFPSYFCPAPHCGEQTLTRDATGGYVCAECQGEFTRDEVRHRNPRRWNGR